MNGDQSREQSGRTRQLTVPPVVTPHVAGGRDDRQRNNEGADAMREMNRDFRIPMIGDEAAEHQREIGNREPGARVPHGRADEDLGVDQNGGGGRKASKRGGI